MKKEFEIKLKYIHVDLEICQSFDTWQEVVDESIKAINYMLNQFPPSDEKLIITLLQGNDILRQHTLTTNHY